MLDYLVEKLLSTPMVVGVDMEEVPSVVRTQLRSIGVQPMLLVGLLNPW